MAGKNGSKKNSRKKTRITHCELCGRKLSMYNNTGVCFSHQYKKDHDGGQWFPPGPSLNAGKF